MGDGLASCPVCGGTVLSDRMDRDLQPLFEVGRVLAGRFRVEEVLGTGASGVVYGVEDTLRKGRAAMKVLWEHAYGGEVALERLRREILASQKAIHPNVVAIYDLLTVEGRPFLLMEWVEGGTLREKVRREGPLPWGEAVRVAESLLSALAHLHGLGVVHRDVKSGNVLLGPNGVVKLGDFGLVKGEDLGMSLTATGTALGTPGYMAPEVIRGREATNVSDLYSLGAVLYEMLAGRLPFQGANSMEVVSRQISEPPPLGPLRERKIPRWLVRVTARLLELDPSDRFHSAKTTLAALRERRGLWLTRRARRALVAGVLASAFMAATALGIRWWRSHAFPTLTSNGATLTAKDAFGRTLFTRTFPSPIQSACTGRFLPGGAAGIGVALDYNVADPRPAGDIGSPLGNTILVLDGQGDTVASHRIHLNGNPFTPRYKVDLSSHRFTSGEADRLVAYVHHIPWYPAGIQVFPPLARERAGTDLALAWPAVFGSSGHIVQPFVFKDLNGDGTDDIAFTCVNNRLYKAYSAGVFFVTPSGVGAANSGCSPDLHFAVQGPRPWYRVVSFHYKMSDLAWSMSPPGFLLQFQGRTFLRLNPDWSCSTPGAASPSDLLWLNDWIGEICRLRSAGEWGQMLSRLSGDRRPFPPPYDWLKRLFTAHALMGLSRYDEALTTLAEGPPIEDGLKPYAAYNLRLNALFLAGRYRECVAEFMGMPESVQKDWPDMGTTAFWAANYVGDDSLSHTFVNGSQMNRYPMPEAPALLEALKGDYVSSESLLLTQKPLESIHPEPALVLIHCLLMQGRVAEARSAFNVVKARFPGERMDYGETELWLLWHENPGNPALLRSMDSLLERKRGMATSDVDVRALLPLTLARAACMHRDAGDRTQAERLLKEVLRLAPEAWRPGLTLK